MLLLGNRDPVGFTIEYAGLVLLGGLIGVVLAWVWPSLPVGPMQQSMSRLRSGLVRHLEALAEGLRQAEPPDEWGWRRRQVAVDALYNQVRTRRQRVEESLRWNRRARHAYATVAEPLAKARLLEKGIDPDQLAKAWEAQQALAEQVGQTRTETEDGLHVASNVVNSLRRLLQQLEQAAGPK